MNKKQLIVAWVMGVLFLSGCAKFNLTKEGGKFTIPFDFPGEQKELKIGEGFCGRSTYGKCFADTDCIKGGCSSQICQSKSEEPITTTCEWSECYKAEAYGVACKCVEGKCQWTR